MPFKSLEIFDMRKWWMVLLSSLLHAASFTKGPYGFAMVDLGISPQDIEHFRLIDIQKNQIFHHYGELENLPLLLRCFFQEIGNNERTALDAADVLQNLIEKVLVASGKKTGWIYLRAFLPTSRFDLPRWHVDGAYYPPDGPDDIPFKYVITLVGPTTLFYPLPLELRKTTEKISHNRQSMRDFCKKELIVSPELGQGAVFVAGKYREMTALHSEPPIHEKRLFLSIVPCTEEQLPALKSRVTAIYPRN